MGKFTILFLRRFGLWRIWRWEQAAKAKATAKAKASKGSFSMPEGREVGVPGKDDAFYCYNYNLGKCDKCKPGNLCTNKKGKRFLHMCCFKNCVEKHKHCDHH